MRPAWVAAGAGAAAVLLAAGVAAAGESAAVPGLGAATRHPPWDLDARPGPAAVTVLLVLADLLAVAAVALGLLAVARGARPRPRVVAGAGLAAVALLVLLPPLGSADHLSYAAYGRIAALGGDPFVQDPLLWRGGTDPVAGAVQPPWQHTPSVYGPVATLAQAAVAVVGDGSLRLTVWGWQLLCGAAFLVTGLLLDRMTRHDPAARARAALLWTLNPLLLRQLVLGGHVDVIAAAAGLAALALAARRPVLAGVMLGLAAGTKAPFALVGLAVLWGLRRLGVRCALRHAGLGLLGAALVLGPAHAWSGPTTYAGLDRATRMISLATPWRLLADELDPVLGASAVRSAVGPAAAICAVLLAVRLARRFAALRVAAAPLPQVGAPVPAEARSDARSDARPDDPHVRPGAAVEQGAAAAVTRDAVRATALLTLAWVLTAPYALPWYDAMVWAPLALLAPSALDAALLARLGVLSLAYVPGRVVALSPDVERITLGFRREVAPWLALVVLVAVIVWGRVGGRGRPQRPAGPRRPAPEPARSPR